MSKSKRQLRDAIVALFLALAPFAYKQATLGNRYVAGVTVTLIAVLILVYRYFDAQVIETARTVADTDNDGDVADDLKPVLRRVGRAIRTQVQKRRGGQ